MLFQAGNFRLHSGAQSAWKIDCDALTDADIETLALIASERLIPFSEVVGIPRGGLRLAAAMVHYVTPGAPPVLIVDDVLTSGASMRETRREINAAGRGVVGLVIFARSDAEPWVKRLFQMEK